jgi:ribosomal-protein-alanine N-acetyltransferase
VKLGFEKEGLMRQYGFWKGQFHDMNLFSLIRDQAAQSEKFA